MKPRAYLCSLLFSTQDTLFLFFQTIFHFHAHMTTNLFALLSHHTAFWEAGSPSARSPAADNAGSRI